MSERRNEMNEGREKRRVEKDKEGKGNPGGGKKARTANEGSEERKEAK